MVTVLSIDAVPDGTALTSIVTTARIESWSRLLGAPLGLSLTLVVLSPFPSAFIVYDLLVRTLPHILEIHVYSQPAEVRRRVIRGGERYVHVRPVVH